MINKERILNTFLELVKIDSETGNEQTVQPILKINLKVWAYKSKRIMLQV